MSRIASIFAKPNHKAFIPYVTVGYPSIEATLKVVPLLAEGGGNLVELGIPFSDPLADGTTIQKASFQALQNGVTPELCLEAAQQLSHRVAVPLMFMSYFNPVLNYGLEDFCQGCADSGIEGLIIPDLPPEEGLELESAAKRHGLNLIYLLAPTSTEKRIRLVAERSQGFIYLVSVTGVTGARDRLPAELGAFVARVRKVTSLPLCVGFGISAPEQAGQVASIADGVIVGSQIIRLMEMGDESLSQIQVFATKMRAALDQTHSL